MPRPRWYMGAQGSCLLAPLGSYPVHRRLQHNDVAVVRHRSQRVKMQTERRSVTDCRTRMQILTRGGNELKGEFVVKPRHILREQSGTSDTSLLNGFMPRTHIRIAMKCDWSGRMVSTAVLGEMQEGRTSPRGQSDNPSTLRDLVANTLT